MLFRGLICLITLPLRLKLPRHESNVHWVINSHLSYH